MIRQSSFPIAPEPASYPSRTVVLPDVRWVVFDVYGTLLSSAAGEIGVAAHSGDRSGEFDTLSQRYGRDGTTGKTIADLFFKTIETHHARLRSTGVPQPEVDIREVWETVIQHLFRPPADRYDPEVIALEYELAVNPVWPMPGCAAVIRECNARSINLGIVSNAQFYTPLLIEALLGSTPETLGFQRCLWSFEIGAAKPSPAIFQRFLETAGIDSPASVLYVGNDMRNDIHAAQAAGMRTALFAGDRRSLRLRTDDPCASMATPDIVLTSLHELYNALPDRESVGSVAKGTHS